jgi:hypothetical protein
METHRNVVIGVTILAILAMFGAFFTVGIVVIGMIDPPESSITIEGGLELVTMDDYFSLPRLGGAMVVALFGSAGLWALVDRLAYPTLSETELVAIDAEDDDL